MENDYSTWQISLFWTEGKEQPMIEMLKYNTIQQYNTMICNAHKVENRTSNLRRGQSLGGRGCGHWLTRMRCEECFKTVFECM